MNQAELRAYWRGGPAGRLCPLEQMRALALRDVHKELHDDEPAPLSWIAERVTKTGGGHPEKQSLHEFFAKVDGDPEWFPGKHSGKQRGPRPVLNKAKRRCIAASAMAAKKAGQEPCIPAVIQACPAATRNPDTGLPFSDFSIRKVFFFAGLLRFRSRAPLAVPTYPAKSLPARARAGASL